MKALIEVTEISTGIIKKSMPMDSYHATMNLENIPDQCSEEEANFKHTMYTIHHADVRDHVSSKFTKMYFDDTVRSIY